MKQLWKKRILAGVACALVAVFALVMYTRLGFADEKLTLQTTDTKNTDAVVTRGVVDKISEIEKDKTQPLGTAKNPFVVLELVPYEGYAEFGYLIGGCEPIAMEKLSYFAEMETIIKTAGYGTGGAAPKKYYYFAEEEGYKEAAAAAGVSGLASIPELCYEVTEPMAVYGYYEFVGEGKGAFEQVAVTGTTNSTGATDGIDASTGNTEGTEATESTGTTDSNTSMDNGNTGNTTGDNEEGSTGATTYEMKWVGEGKGNIAWFSQHRLDEATTLPSEIPVITQKLSQLEERITTFREYTADRENKLYVVSKYTYQSNELFLKNSLKIAEDKIADYSIVVKTITPKELNESVSGDSSRDKSNNWVAKADLISIAPTSHVSRLPELWQRFNKLGKSAVESPATDFATQDLSWEATMMIYKKVLSESDYSVLVMDADSYDIDKLPEKVKKDDVTYGYQIDWDGKRVSNSSKSVGCSNNVYKLGIMLRCMNPYLFNNLYLKDFDGIQALVQTKNDTGYFRMQGSNENVDSVDAEKYWNPYIFMPTDEEGKTLTNWEWDNSTRYDVNLAGTESISGHIYTYNDDTSLSSLFLKEKILCPPKNEETTGNKHTKELFDWIATQQGSGIEKATPAQALEYVLRGKANDIAESGFKAAIHILEIQPCKSFSLRERRFYFTIPEFSGTITVEQQTSSEFLGKTEDLNSLYDMIYIGTNADTLNSSMKGDWETGSKEWVYRHTGSKVTTKDSSHESNVKNKLLGNFGDNDSVTTFYYSGNDISKIKEAELVEFAKAGYPVVFGGNFFKDEAEGDKTKAAINTTKIDTASNFYSFANTIATDTTEGYVLYREGKMEADGTLEQFKAALTMKHCSLVLNEATPIRYKDRTYTATDGSKPYASLTDEEIYVNGKDLANVQLDFEFHINDNNADVEELYGAALYIDENADGRYVEDEAQSVLVYDMATGKQMKNTRLKANTTYKLTCKAGEYVGVLPWKLEVYRRDNERIRDMELGMSAIKIYNDLNNDNVVDKKDRTVIQVLQITSSSNKVTLPTDTERSAIEKGNTGSINTVTQNFHKYTKNLEEFDIHFTRCSVAEFENESNGHIADVNNGKYNMLILGFADMYTDISSQKALESIEGAIERGISVLFTHDTTSFVNKSKSAYGSSDFWGYHINKYFREMVGMDRYGVTVQYPLAETGEKALSIEECLENGKDVPYVTGATQGLVDEDGDGIYENIYSVAKSGETTTGKAPSTPKLCSHSSGTWQTKNTTGHRWTCSSRNCSKKMSNVQAHNSDTAVITKAPTTTSEGIVKYYCSVCAYYMREETLPKLTSEAYYIIQGYNNAILYRYSQNSGSNQTTKKVTQTNTGQITEYPYKMEESFAVAETHSQYYQLDMEADDIVVWYCLSDGGSNNWSYGQNPNDVRNNYYIYNRGNITYSGVGHNGDLTESETKLFVNTMVAAYSAAAVLPTISITNEDTVSMGAADAMYVNYDYTEKSATSLALQDFLQDSIDISYKVIENNILANKKMKIKYYLLGKKKEDGKYEFSDEQWVINGGNKADGGYYEEDKNSNRIDPHTLLSMTTMEDGETQGVSGEEIAIKANTEYSFNYMLTKAIGETTESLFQQTHYIPLEIELTLTYGKKQDKKIVVRKPIILYRRAMFMLD